MKIGVFDSGLGGLSILKQIRHLMPEYDYLYLGDSARAPYGTRSFDVIYDYTLQAVRYLQSQGCRLIILACNTASAKALRNIQQRDINPDELRVLGVIRPTVEAIPAICPNEHIGILATQGTVNSESYVIEINKLSESLGIATPFVVSQQACPMWVPLIENGEKDSPAMDYFVDKYLSELLSRDPEIRTILLGCTHYPLIGDKIESWLKAHTQQDEPCKVLAQGELVAASLQDYLSRHGEIASLLSRGGTCHYQTTESAARFSSAASLFLDTPITATHVEL